MDIKKKLDRRAQLKEKQPKIGKINNYVQT